MKRDIALEVSVVLNVILAAAAVVGWLLAMQAWGQCP